MHPHAGRPPGPLARAAALALLAGALAQAQAAQAQTAQAAQAQQTARPAPHPAQRQQGPAPQEAARWFHIPPGPLGEALNRYALAAGVTLSFSAARTQGLHSPGLQGSHTVAQGFARLLRGTGLQARPSGPGRYTLAPAAGAEALPGSQSERQPERQSERPGAEATLPTVQVLGRASAFSEGSGSYAAQASTIGRRELALHETPQSVSVLTRQRLDDQNLHSLEQALAQTPGITVNAAAAGVVYDYYARGFPLLNVAFDGVSMLTGWGGFDGQPDLATVDRIEVLRGADGLYAGAGQPSGTVNAVRKRPLARRRLGAQLSLGAWSQRRAELDATGPLNASGSLRGRAVLAYQHKGFFFDAPAAHKQVAYAMLEADTGPRGTVGLGASHQKAHFPMETGHPRASDGRDLRLPRRRSFTAPWSRYDFETSQLFADWQHAFDADWSLRANASLLKETSVFKGAYVRGSHDPARHGGLSLRGNAGRYESRQYGLDLSVEGRVRLFSRWHGLSIGASHGARDNPGFVKQGWQFPPEGQPVPLHFDPGHIAEPAMPALARTSETKIRQSGLYGVLRWSLGDSLTLVSGARASWYQHRRRELPSGQSSQQHRQQGQLTPYAGLLWHWHPRHTFYASYSDIFRVQSQLYQASGKPLAPAVGRNYEIGLKSRLADGRLHGALALFRTDERHRAQIDPQHPADCPGHPGGGACHISAGQVRSQGLEAELNGQLRRGWHWFAGYTYNAAKYLRDRKADGTPSANEGQPLRSIAPRHMLRLYTRYELGRAWPGWQGWSLGGGLSAQSATHVGAARQPGYAVWSASVGYAPRPALALRLSVDNLLDKHYYRRIGLREGNMYGAPRSFTLSARMDF